MTGWVAGLLMLALLQQAAPSELMFSGPLVWSLKIRDAPSIDAPPFSFDPTVDEGLSWTCDDCVITLPPTPTFYIAIFGRRTRASGIVDDMDYRCMLVVSRDKENGWLIDRKENTAVRIASQELPEWCSE
jgi:hypothetical protein